MPVKQIESAGNAIKAVAGIIALFPGIVVLLGLVAIPPSLADLVKIISFSISGVVLLAVFLMGDRIQRLSKGRTVFYTVTAVVLGAACATFYFQFANRHTVIVETGPASAETYIIPLDPSERIREVVAPLDYDYKVALQAATQRAELRRWMVDESGSSMAVMIVLLVLSQILLVAPVVAAAWRLAAAPDAQGPDQGDAPAGGHAGGSD